MANASFDLPAGAWEDGSTVSGTDLRRGQLLSMAANGSGLIVRGGVRAARSNTLAVSLPGGMFVRIAPGHGVVPAASGEGGYAVSLPSQQDLPVTAANGTNPRIDTVGLEVVPGSPTLWRVRLLDGTPAASPSAPTYAVSGGFFLPLADVRTNALGTAPTSVTDRRAYTAAAGGVIQYPGFRALSGATQTAVMATLPLGTPIWDESAGELGIVTAAGWAGYQQTVTQWGMVATSVGEPGIPSDTTFRRIPFTAIGDNYGVAAPLVSGRIVLPFTGIYQGYLKVSWVTGTSTSAGRRAGAVEVNGSPSAAGIITGPYGHPNSTSQYIPIRDRYTAGTTLGASVWADSGVGVQKPTTEIGIDLIQKLG